MREVPLYTTESSCTPYIRKRTPLGPYSRPMPRVLGGSQGGGRLLMSEVTQRSLSAALGGGAYVAVVLVFIKLSVRGGPFTAPRTQAAGLQRYLAHKKTPTPLGPP
jgi:hypothetical protein